MNNFLFTSDAMQMVFAGSNMATLHNLPQIFNQSSYLEAPYWRMDNFDQLCDSSKKITVINFTSRQQLASEIRNWIAFIMTVWKITLSSTYLVHKQILNSNFFHQYGVNPNLIHLGLRAGGKICGWHATKWGD